MSSSLLRDENIKGGARVKKMVTSPAVSSACDKSWFMELLSFKILP